MKNLTLIFLTLFTYSVFSQTTYVPDDNFEQALIDLGYDSGPLDDQVTTANINGITILDIGGKNIADLTGIEDFTALEELYCWVNNISSLDVSANLNLFYLEARENQITTVNVSSNINLEVLSLGDNLFSNIDVSSNINLQLLSLKNNSLSNLDVSSNLNLEALHISNSGINSIDVSANTQLLELTVSDNNISSLDVNANINLKELNISETSLTEIDLSTNVNLEILQSIEVFGITELDLSACINLKRLWHADGSLSNLILPEINTIEWLLLDNNNLTTVDFLPNDNNLELFYLQGNQITEMDLSSKGTILWLRANDIDGLISLDIRNTNVSIMYADENPNLLCIFVDDASWASSYVEYATDSTATFVETEAECNVLLSVNDVDYSEISLKIYPNPVQEQFSILSNITIENIKIYNVTGKLVKVYDNEQDSYNVSDLAKAVYFVSIKSKKGTAVKKLVIE